MIGVLRILKIMSAFTTYNGKLPCVGLQGTAYNARTTITVYSLHVHV